MSHHHHTHNFINQLNISLSAAIFSSGKSTPHAPKARQFIPPIHVDASIIMGKSTPHPPRANNATISWSGV